MLDWILGLIEWVANDAGSAVATIFPYALVGLVLLYGAWVVVGYMRVSQIGREEEIQLAGQAARVARAPDGVLEVEPGVPYCDHCALRYPPGAVFCLRCEGDLSVDCTTCGARLRASDEVCARCGTRRGVSSVPALSGGHG